jgi:hypothetical protein
LQQGATILLPPSLTVTKMSARFYYQLRGSPSKENCGDFVESQLRPLPLLPTARNLWEAKNYQLCKTVTDGVDCAL